MLAREMLITLFEYNQWANGRVLDQAEKVTDAQWTAEPDPEGRSLQEILAHYIRTERVWRLLSAHGMIRDGDLPDIEELGTVEALREFSEAEAELMQVLLQDWSDDSFDEEVMVTRWDGKTYPIVRWQMLQHLLLHSMQHRSEAALLLTEFGHSAGDIDFLFFI
ncbi:MAG: DinB family protein [Candidatus Promineifilaceae bacterium]|jgi:uncharacterized damage-inducible protein DinB